MITRLKLPIVLLAFMGSPAAMENCETGCHTTIVVTDCSGAAVSGAKIEVKLCCGDNAEVDVRTSQDGAATVNYCLKDICKTRIVLDAFAVSAIDRNGCSGDGKNSRCEVQMCKR